MNITKNACFIVNCGCGPYFLLYAAYADNHMRSTRLVNTENKPKLV